MDAHVTLPRSVRRLVEVGSGVNASQSASPVGMIPSVAIR